MIRATPDRAPPMPTPDPAPLIQLALQHEALRLGQFTLKSGRSSPYFFNMAQLHTGQALRMLAGAYADVLQDADIDLLFGPAYKGIPLVAAVATELAGRGVDLPWAFNRKEAKNHGEGGSLVGAPITGRVAVLDDVLTAGTAIRESVGIIQAAGGTPAVAVIALNRQEPGADGRTAVEALSADTGMAVHSLFSARDIADAVAASQPDAAAAIGKHLAAFGN